MANILSLDSAGKLKIASGTYNVTLGAELPKTRDSVTAMKAVVAEIEAEAGKIGADPKLKKAVAESLEQLEKLGAPKANIKAIGEAFAFKAGKTVEATTAALVENPLARKVLGDAKVAAMGVEDIAKLDGLIAARGKLAELVKADKIDKKAIEAIFIEQHGASREVKAALTSVKPSTLSGIAADVGTKITEGVTKVTAAATKLGEIEAKIIEAEAAGASEKAIAAIARQKTQYENVIKAVTDSTKHAHGNKVLQIVEKESPELFDTAKAASKELASHMEAGLKNVTKATAEKGGNKLLSIFHGENALKDIAKKEGVAVEKLGFLKKVRPGKAAALAGIAAVGAYFVAGIGGKGPSEHAETVANKSHEPVVGRA